MNRRPEGAGDRGPSTRNFEDVKLHRALFDESGWLADSLRREQATRRWRFARYAATGLLLVGIAIGAIGFTRGRLARAEATQDVLTIEG